MRGSVVAHGGLSNVEVHHGVDLVANADRLLGGDLMSPHALDGVIASLHVGDDACCDRRDVEPSAVADLSAGFGVEGRVIEDDLAFFAGL